MRKLTATAAVLLARAGTRNLLAAAALAGLGVGFGLAWLPLGLIVPSGVVLALAVLGHLLLPPAGGG